MVRLAPGHPTRIQRLIQMSSFPGTLKTYYQNSPLQDPTLPKNHVILKNASLSAQVSATLTKD